MSVGNRDLKKQLKAATKTGKYVVGRKEVLQSLKGSKMLVWSASANVPPQILETSKTLGIPALRFDGNPIQLGKACGIPFKVSVIAIKSQGESDLASFQNAKDYSPQVAALPQMREPQRVAPVAVESASDKRKEDQGVPGAEKTPAPKKGRKAPSEPLAKKQAEKLAEEASEPIAGPAAQEAEPTETEQKKSRARKPAVRKTKTKTTGTKKSKSSKSSSQKKKKKNE
jgi:large subunit ribosomal protein L30e